MKIFELKQSRQDYLKTQIDRSERKFQYCKVSINDALRIREFILGLKSFNFENSAFVCFGTRNGREVDLFRCAFRNQWIANLIKTFEISRYGFRSYLDFIFNFGRDVVGNRPAQGFFGVELNPRGSRKDVWVGSFDEMPNAWENVFNVVFSNSFDQSMDPEKTAKEWIRVMKNGAIIIFHSSPNAEPTIEDPIGKIELQDVLKLFPGNLLNYSPSGSQNGYDEIIIQINK